MTSNIDRFSNGGNKSQQYGAMKYTKNLTPMTTNISSITQFIFTNNVTCLHISPNISEHSTISGVFFKVISCSTANLWHKLISCCRNAIVAVWTNTFQLKNPLDSYIFFLNLLIEQSIEGKKLLYFAGYIFQRHHQSFLA